MIEKILRFSISSPVFAKVVLISVLVFSTISYFKIRKLSYPRVDFNKIEVTTAYPGASAKDVEINVTRHIEDAIKEVEGIQKFTSTSMENYSLVTITLDPGHDDLQQTKADIRSTIDSVNKFPHDLPNGPFVREIKVDNIPIYEVALVYKNMASDKSKQREIELKLRTHIERLKKRIGSISSVSKMSLRGYRDREITIYVDREKIKEKKISFDEIIIAIKENKLRLAGGSIESFKVKSNLITISEFQTPKQLSQIIIRSNISGKMVRLKDIARVVDDFEKRAVIAKYNGFPGASLWIFKKANADIIKTIDEVKKVVGEYRKNFDTEGIEFISTLDNSIPTKSRLTMVFTNMFIGFILVLVILFIFLTKKISFWTAMGIPISVGTLFIFMPLFGLSFNAISLCGIIVVLGMVVDDAIIISEFTYKELSSGKDPVTASINAVTSVVKPVLTTILTTIIAFLPIYFIPGLVGDFAREIPTIVIIVLIASFFEAIILLPTHISRKWRPSDNKIKPLGDFIFVFLEKAYSYFLKIILRWRYLFVGLVVFVLVIGYMFSLRKIDFVMFPEDQAYQIFIAAETNPEFRLEYTDKVAKRVESVIKKLPSKEVQAYRTVVGRVLFRQMTCEYCFYIKLILTPFQKRDRSAKEIKQVLDTELAKDKNSNLRKVSVRVYAEGPDFGRAIEINVQGNNDKKRHVVEQQMLKKLRSLPLENVESNRLELIDGIHLTPKYGNVAMADLSVSRIASTIRTVYEGTIVTNIIQDQEDIPVRLTLDKTEELTEGLTEDPFRDLMVQNRSGRLIPVKSLVKVKKNKEETKVYHYNGDRNNTIWADISPKSKMSSKEIYESLSLYINKIQKMHPDIFITLEGEGKASSEAYFNALSSLTFAIICIYVLLVLQFQSFLQPFMVLSVIPFGIIGMSFIFKLHGIPLSYMALMGVIGFSGVVINDALVMIDFINQLNKGGATDVKKR